MLILILGSELPSSAFLQTENTMYWVFKTLSQNVLISVPLCLSDVTKAFWITLWLDERPLQLLQYVQEK